MSVDEKQRARLSIVHIYESHCLFNGVVDVKTSEVFVLEDVR